MTDKNFSNEGKLIHVNLYEKITSEINIVKFLSGKLRFWLWNVVWSAGISSIDQTMVS